MKAYSKILTFCGVVLIIAGVLLLIASPLALAFAVLGVILIANARMVSKSVEPVHQGEPEETPQTAPVSQESRKDDSSRAETTEPAASVPPPTPEEIREADARFRAELEAIPDRTEIVRSGKKRARYDLVGFPELKTSNIISTSHLDRLGSFAVIDVETTGLKPVKDRIVEVSAIRFDGWEPVGRFSTLVNPEMHIPDDAARIHGITDEDITDAWQRFVSAHMREDMDALIQAERLKPEPAKRFMTEAFREGEIKETGTAIDRMMPPVSRFGHSGRGEKKQRILDALRDFFDKYSGIVSAEGQNGSLFAYKAPGTQDVPLAAEEKAVLEVVKKK